MSEEGEDLFKKNYLTFFEPYAQATLSKETKKQVSKWGKNWRCVGNEVKRSEEGFKNIKFFSSYYDEEIKTSLLALYYTKPKIEIWDLSTGKLKRTIETYVNGKDTKETPIPPKIQEINFCQYSTEKNKEIYLKLVIANRDTLVFSLTGKFISESHKLTVLPKATNFSFVFEKQQAKIVEKDGKLVRVLERNHTDVLALACDRNFRRIVSGNRGGVVTLWDARSGGQLSLLQSHKGAVTCLDCTPDMRWVVSGGNDCRIQLYDTRMDKNYILNNEEDNANLSPVKSLKLFFLRDASLLSYPKKKKIDTYSSYFSQWYIASGHENGHVYIWARQKKDNGIVRYQCTRHREAKKAVKVLQVCPAKKWLYFSNTAGKVSKISLDKNNKGQFEHKETETVAKRSTRQSNNKNEQKDICSIFCSGESIYFADTKGNIFKTNQALEIFKSVTLTTMDGGSKESSSVSSIIFDKDAQLVAIGRKDGKIEIYKQSDPKNFYLVQNLRQQKHSINSMRFFENQDLGLILSASDDGTIKAYNTKLILNERTIGTGQVHYDTYNNAILFQEKGQGWKRLFFKNKKWNEKRILLGSYSKLALNPNTNGFFAVVEDNKLKIKNNLNIDKLGDEKELQSYPEGIDLLEFFDEGKQLYVTSSDQISIWEKEPVAWRYEEKGQKFSSVICTENYVVCAGEKKLFIFDSKGKLQKEEKTKGNIACLVFFKGDSFFYGLNNKEEVYIESYKIEEGKMNSQRLETIKNPEQEGKNFELTCMAFKNQTDSEYLYILTGYKVFTRENDSGKEKESKKEFFSYFGLTTLKKYQPRTSNRKKSKSLKKISNLIQEGQTRFQRLETEKKKTYSIESVGFFPEKEKKIFLYVVDKKNKLTTYEFDESNHNLSKRDNELELQHHRLVASADCTKFISTIGLQKQDQSCLDFWEFNQAKNNIERTNINISKNTRHMATCLAFSPDSALIVTGHGEKKPPTLVETENESDDESVMEPYGQRKSTRIREKNTQKIEAYQKSEKGQVWVYSFNHGNIIQKYNLDSRIEHKSKITGVAFSRDTKNVISVDAQGKVTSWHLSDNYAEVKTIPTKTEEIVQFHYIDALPNKKFTLLRTLKGIKFLNLQTRTPKLEEIKLMQRSDEVLKQIESKIETTNDFSYVNVLERVKIAFWLKNKIYVCSAEFDNKCLYFLQSQEIEHKDCSCVYLSPTGQYLIAGTKDGVITMWELDDSTTRQVQEFKSGNGGEKKRITWLRMTSDEQYLFSYDSLGGLKTWDAVGGAVQRTIPAHTWSLSTPQRKGIEWFLKLYDKGRLGCVLADEMGMGKTLQLLSYFQYLYLHRGAGPFLVIVPKKTIEGWKKETARIQHLQAFEMTKNVDKQKSGWSEISDNVPQNFVFITSAFYIRNKPKNANTSWGYADFAKTPLSVIAIDEAHRELSATISTDDKGKIQNSLSTILRDRIKEFIDKQKGGNLPKPQILLSTGTPFRTQFSDLNALFLLATYGVQEYEKKNEVFENRFLIQDENKQILEPIFSNLEDQTYKKKFELYKEKTYNMMRRRDWDDLGEALEIKKKREAFVLLEPLEDEKKAIENYLKKYSNEVAKDVNEDEQKKIITDFKKQLDNYQWHHSKEKEFNKSMILAGAKTYFLDCLLQSCLKDKGQESQKPKILVFFTRKDIAKALFHYYNTSDDNYKSRVGFIGGDNVKNRSKENDEEGTDIESTVAKDREEKKITVDEIINKYQLKSTLDQTTYDYYLPKQEQSSTYQDLFNGNTNLIQENKKSRKRTPITINFEPTCDLLFIMTEAGGAGINLPEAEVVVLFHSAVRPSDDKQAIARGLRKNSKTDVDVYRLICKQSVEEHDMTRYVQRLNLAYNVLEYRMPKHKVADSTQPTSTPTYPDKDAGKTDRKRTSEAHFLKSYEKIKPLTEESLETFVKTTNKLKMSIKGAKEQFAEYYEKSLTEKRSPWFKYQGILYKKIPPTLQLNLQTEIQKISQGGEPSFGKAFNGEDSSNLPYLKRPEKYVLEAFLQKSLFKKFKTHPKYLPFNIGTFGKVGEINFLDKGKDEAKKYTTTMNIISTEPTHFVNLGNGGTVDVLSENWTQVFKAGTSETRIILRTTIKINEDGDFKSLYLIIRKRSQRFLFDLLIYDSRAQYTKTGTSSIKKDSFQHFEFQQDEKTKNTSKRFNDFLQSNFEKKPTIPKPEIQFHQRYQTLYFNRFKTKAPKITCQNNHPFAIHDLKFPRQITNK